MKVLLQFFDTKQKGEVRVSSSTDFQVLCWTIYSWWIETFELTEDHQCNVWIAFEGAGEVQEQKGYFGERIAGKAFYNFDDCAMFGYDDFEANVEPGPFLHYYEPSPQEPAQPN